jgi:hypothetical protein
MPDKSARDSNHRATNDASTKAMEREKAVADKEVPVKQHNPGEKGLNPDQRGPAQPTGSDE